MVKEGGSEGAKSGGGNSILSSPDIAGRRGVMEGEKR